MSIRASSALALASVLCIATVAPAQADSSLSTPIAPLTRVPAAQAGVHVWTVDSAQISHSTAPTFSELLQARLPGLRVLRSGGLVSDGAFVMLRGPTSFFGPNTPIVIVDGVRVDSRQADQPLAIGSGAPSRLDDLSPEEIERVEVLSGPAAAVYGAGASNGVILVTTKSGAPGPLRLSSRVSWAATQSHTDFPANYRRVGVSPSNGQPVADCSLVAVTQGLCAPTGLNSWNPLEQASPFRTGSSVRARLALSGSPLGTSIYGGLTASGQQGVLSHDAADRIAFRGKVARDLPGHFTVEASGGSLREHARSAVDGNFSGASNIIANGLLGAAVNDANRGNAVHLPADSLFPAARLRHNTGGVTLSWQPGPGFVAAVMTGRDLVTERWHADHIGPDVSPSTSDHRYTDRNDMRTSAATVSSAYELDPGIEASTALGFERDVLQTAAYDSISNPFSFGYSESFFSMRSTSAWVTETIQFPGHVDAAASLEHVSNDIFGSDVGHEWFPSGNVSWSPAVSGHGLSSLHLRAAYAEVPGATGGGISLGAVIPTSPSPFTPRVKMERTKQIEVGGDIMVGDLTSISLTAFDNYSTHLWAVGPAQPGGSAAQIGTMTNIGVEAEVGARLLDVRAVRWDGTFSLALLHNRIGNLPVPPFFGTSTNLIAAGHPLGGVFAQPYTYADVNHDGIIAPSEVQVGTAQYAGPALPTFESAFQSSVTLPGRLELSALLDYRRGNRAVDMTGEIRCQAQTCRETQDPSAPLDLQAAAVARRFDSDASFMRLREIALRWTVPSAGARFLGVGAEVTVAGRNLAMWTKYRGLDPEITYQPPDILLRQEFLRMPIPRELVVRLDVRP